MKPGTKNQLFGEHQIIIHALFVARAWWKLFGFPKDLRLWACFFLHDLGYWGKDDIDGEDGKTHPELGANIVSYLFDEQPFVGLWNHVPIRVWYEFCLYHSRYYAKKEDHPVSALALADKMAFVITPWWVFIPLAKFSGGLKEYAKLYGKEGKLPKDLKPWIREQQARCWDWVYRTMEQPSSMKGYYTSWERQNMDAELSSVQEG
jgi:hypothetical protein